ncbi:MAG: recombinase family protein [Oscillospiraceae bacterium]|nr:recombinase family protein [Oscillospiraceae bacterium]
MIKVAVYCRVSTDKDDQANSFEAQQRYFKKYIDRMPEWDHYRTYADEGISGTSTIKRAQFNRMIADAREGRFGLIITKEVSRFSRNILDTISYTRELRALGVGVLFVNDGINTLEPDSELRLSIMGSIAQEESRKTSTRVKWGQTRQMERGVVFGRSLLGYDVKGGIISVNPEGAEIVRLIFRKYGIENKSTSEISRELREAGYKTLSGGDKWSCAHIIKILNNEKYVGDLIQKKTITPDYLSHTKKYNHGEEPMITLRDHHEPIIDRELWDEVQKELKRRNRHTLSLSGRSNSYVFSGKIDCGECGASFVSRRKKRSDGSFVRRWCCGGAAMRGAEACGVGRAIRDDAAAEIMGKAIASIRFDRELIIDNLTKLVSEAIQSGEESAEKLALGVDRLMKKKASVLDSFISEIITEDEMRLMTERYDGELSALREKIANIPACERDNLRNKVAAVVYGEAGCDTMYKMLLEKMTVYKDGRVAVRLKHLTEAFIFSLF